MQTLLVDDDPTIIIFTERLFQPAGQAGDLTLFQSPANAVAFLREQVQAGTPPEVVLLDLNMPLMLSASTTAANNTLTRLVLRSAAWTLFFFAASSVPTPPERRIAHGWATDSGQPDTQLRQRGIGLMAQTGHQLRLGGRTQTRNWPTAMGQGRQ
jgi:CheY-like chemotaxis protein